MNRFAHLFISLCLLIFIACEEQPIEPQCDGSLKVDIVSTTDSDCSQDVGKVEVRAIGGNGSYRFRIDGGALQTAAIFEGVAAGEHMITVLDSLDCEATVSVNLKSGVTFDDIQPIISSNCAVSGCHDGTTNQVDLRPAANIKSRASNIKTLTEDKAMPPDTAATSLTDTQIQLIGCWVDDGAR